jgi:hypothetical protein
MPETVRDIKARLIELELLQRKLGQIQMSLFAILTDEVEDEWDVAAQEAILKLEDLQCGVGDVQTILLEPLHRAAPLSTEDRVETESNESERAPAVEDRGTDDARPTVEFQSPHEWLLTRGIEIRSMPEPGGLDEAADRAARFLGDRFENLAPFYDALKRRVSGNTRIRWLAVGDLSAGAISDICQFGAKLHGAAFLAEFRYHKRGIPQAPANQPVIWFKPVEDGRVTQFLTGGWLERYVRQVISGAIEEITGSWDQSRLLSGVLVRLPHGRDAEFDFLVGLAGGEVIWLECKTGDWQTYVERYRDLNQNHMRLPPERAGLVLLQQLEPHEKNSATDLAGMSVMHVGELRAWLQSACPKQAAPQDVPSS